MSHVIEINVGGSLKELVSRLRSDPSAPAIVPDDTMVKEIVLRHCPEFLNVRTDDVLPGADVDGDPRKGIHTIIRFADRLALVCRFTGNTLDHDNGWMAVIAPATMNDNEACSMLIGMIEGASKPGSPVVERFIPKNPSLQ